MAKGGQFSRDLQLKDAKQHLKVWLEFTNLLALAPIGSVCKKTIKPIMGFIFSNKLLLKSYYQGVNLR